MAVGTTGILGGVFDPPHNGHVALARAALRELELAELLVLVVADPGHKGVVTPAETRLELARIAFEGVQRTTVELDPHARTVDSLEERKPRDAVFVLGADELVAFREWKSPERVLELVRLGVAMRPGTSPDAVRAVARRLGDPDAGARVRARARPGLVVGDPGTRRARAVGRRPRPVGVAWAIRRLGLYAAPE